MRLTMRRFALRTPSEANPSDIRSLASTLRSTGPALLFGLRLWVAVCLALYVAFWLELDNAYWAGSSAAIVCQPTLGASLRRASFQMVGTVVGAVAIVVLTACFPQDRAAFLLSLALWVAVCGFFATILRNAVSFGAGLAGFTAVIIAGDELGATGGVNGEAFTLALTRLSEICIGIASAAIVLAGTDFGQARQRLTTQFAALSAEIAGRLMDSLLLAGPIGKDTRPVRRALIRRVAALGPNIDEALAESSDLRGRSQGLGMALEGLLAALSGWRKIANHLEILPDDRRRSEAQAILRSLPLELRSAWTQVDATGWAADAARLRRSCMAAANVLLSLPAGTPSLRLLADGTEEALIGISHTLNGLALLTGSDQAVLQVQPARQPIPDFLPALVNATRVFVTIGAVELFWIATAWPNGVSAVVWSAIFIITVAPRGDHAYDDAKDRLLGIGLAAALAAIVKFAVLPALDTFVGLGIAIGLVLIPAGAFSTLSWRPLVFAAISSWLLFLIIPENQITYDTTQYYNLALAMVAGPAAATLAFRLLPPLSPQWRTRRLLALTLRDLRRLATNPFLDAPADWQSLVYGRFAAMPEQAELVQHARLVAALSVGLEIISLRSMTRRFGLQIDLEGAFDALAQGNSAVAIERLAWIERILAALTDAGRVTSVGLPMRASFLAITETLADHGDYFDEKLP
jgi:uncharacterized membrane protein YccC